MLTLLCAVFSTAWGETAKLTNANIVAAGGAQTGYTDWTITDGSKRTWKAHAIKYFHSNPTSDKHFLQIKKFASNIAYYIQLPEFDDKILSIKMTVSNSSKPMDGGGNAATLFFSNSNSTSATGTGVASGTGDNTVTIDCSTLNLKTGFITASGAVRIWDIEVEYGSVETPVVTLGELSPTDITLGDLDEFDLEITPADGITESDYTLSWVSSDPTNFEIDGNTYSANAEGNYTVTVTASTTKEGFKNVSKEFDVTVTGVDPALKFEPSFLNVDIGGTGSSTFTKATTANVTFSNDNPTVATYDPETGDITALAEGKAKITATAPQNGQYKAGTATLTIEVIDPNRKGTFNNPYTVQDVIEKGTSVNENGQYVTGYIVGYWKNNVGYQSTADDNTNVVISDDITDTEKIIPVQLQSNTIYQTALNIAQNDVNNMKGSKVLIKGNLTKYFKSPGVKSLSEAYIITNISSVGYSTAYYSNASLLVPDGTVATTVKLGDDGKLVYTPVADNIIPAGTGVVLQGSGEQKLKVTTTSNTVSNNDLLGFDVASVTVGPGGETEGYLFYMLSGGVNGVGFYYATKDSEGNTVDEPYGQPFISGAHKAYLAVEDTGGTTVSSYVFDDFTDIKTIDTEVRTPEGVYTITGVRMNSEHLPAGLYIVNGKKVIIK